MLKKVCFFFFFLFSISLLLGQNSVAIDSLEKILQFAKNDTNKINLLGNISVQYNLGNPSKSLYYAQKQLNLALELKWEKGLSNAYFNIGEANYTIGNYTAALTFFTKDLMIRKKINDKKNICRALARIGAINEEQSNYEIALEYYIKALKLADEIGDENNIVVALCDVACVHKDLGDYTKALEYYFKSLNLAKKTGNKEKLAINSGNIGAVYQDIGDYTKALEYDFKALEIDKQLGNKKNIASWMLNIGGVYHLMGDTAQTKGNLTLQKELDKKSINYLTQSLEIFSVLGDKGVQAIILGNIGRMYTKRKNYPLAEEYLNRSFALATEMNYTTEILDGNQRFYDLYKAMNMNDKALPYYEKYIDIKDSLQEINNKKIITELQVKYETEKKEDENKDLIRKNELQGLKITNHRYLVGGLISLLVVLIVIGILFIRQNQLRAYQQATQLEQKLLRTQMNPHFIFNSLASIESFIYEHEPKEAGVYLSSFSRLMRLILENSSSEYITLEKEIETLNYYLSLQKLRLDGNLSYSIEVNNSIHNEEIYLPPMLTQPFIENAIEHGFRGANEQGNIKIIFSIKEDDLQVEVIDNGIGIEQAQQQKYLHHKHKSMAIEITIERLKFLNRSKKKKLTFDISDISNKKNGQSGTKVLFSIPLGLQNNKI